MKRILAGLLAVGMAAALSLAPAMAETDAGSESAATDREETMTASVVQSSAEPTHLEFDDIRAVLRHNSYTVKSLEAALSDLNHQDTDELWDAIRQMRTLKSTLEQSLKAASDAYNALSASLQPPTTVDPGEGGDTGAETGGEGDTGTGGDVTPELPDPTDAYLLTALGGLQAALSADVANVEMQIASLESQLDSVDSTIETTENTLNNTINQLVKGVETLYIGVVTMESSLDAIQRGIDTLDRTIAIYEKQYELGMASQYEVEAMAYQRSTLASQLEALRFQIETSKVTLEGMCGLELRGAIELGELPLPTEEELADVSYEKYLEKGTKQNVDVMNAKVDEDYDSSTANRYAVTAAEQTFAYNFMVLCMTVEEKDRLVGVAEEALDFQQRTFEITAKQYELGMISQEEYRAGENDLLTAQESVNTARLELFTAYRNYIWARDYGLI